VPALALRLRAVSKTFPGVRALVDFDMDVRAGSVHALLGPNGCGKSTLIKCLAGVHKPDPGSGAWMHDDELVLGDPTDAERKGLRFVHQELGIIPELGALDNVGFVLGFERGRAGAISWRRQEERTTELLNRFGFDLDLHLPLGDASPPERAAVAIVRAVAGWQEGRGVLVLDEPTASLPAHEVDELFRLIRQVSATGTAVILVSHRLDEVMAIADHVTVMREGSKIWDGALSSTSLPALVDLIAGTDSSEQRDEQASGPPVDGRATGETGLAVDARDVRGRYLRGVTVQVAPGEIVGIAGLLGSGREELPYVLAGAARAGVSGTFTIGGVTMRELSIERARALGVALVPADRARESIFADFTTSENVSIACLPKLRRRGALQPGVERRFALDWLKAVHADIRYAPRPMSTLSGGNQQKAVLARWLGAAPRVLVLSEPTAGVDIGARQGIYGELRRRAADGLAVLVASSDLEDLLACCDRVVTLRDGVVAAEFAREQMTKSAIAYAMEGAHDEQR
jgi:ribose transport system ATP-binding protein